MGELRLNERAAAVADELAGGATELGATVARVGGARVIDAGAKTPGSLGAGILTARACLADLACVQWSTLRVGDADLPAVAVAVNQPVAACMASQYAGWQIKTAGYFAMGSGPMRAAYGKEEIFEHVGFRESPPRAVGVLETAEPPTEEVVAYIAERCKLPPAELTLIIARTASLAGSVQVVARSVETAMHKLHALGFSLRKVVAGFGVAPLPPVAKNDLAAIGRTNDAVLYGGRVTLYVTGDDAELADVGARLPSSASKDYGRPFARVFKDYGHDFYKVDPMLFSPAAVVLQNIQTGSTHRFGQVNDAVLAESFFS